MVEPHVKLAAEIRFKCWVDRAIAAFDGGYIFCDDGALEEMGFSVRIVMQKSIPKFHQDGNSYFQSIW